MNFMQLLTDPSSIAVIIPVVALVVLAAVRSVMKRRERSERVQTGIGPEHVLFEDDDVDVRETTTTHAA